MKYTVVRNEKYDYAKQSYGTVYPNLHRYPATMIPQLGIDILKEFGITKGAMLDPYCGSGSSFVCGLECGLSRMAGFDLNPLAVLISKARYTALSTEAVEEERAALRNNIYELLKDENKVKSGRLPRLEKPPVTNIDFWFSPEVITNLSIIKYFIQRIKHDDVRDFFLLPFSETIRDCSYTRNNEFKLYRMKEADLLRFNPDTISLYFKHFDEIWSYYKLFYLPKLSKDTTVSVYNTAYSYNNEHFDVVLTSPPYGDSRTTVAYGQFSTLSNEWLGIAYARKIDGMLMGGAKIAQNINEGIIADYINQISKADGKRALDVSAFYRDLGESIKNVARSINKGGKIIYVAGNRTVKKVLLPTDQFIAEQFEKYGFHHLVTYERALSNKSMPSRNSPTNEAGKTVTTMLCEYIIVSEKA